MPRKGENIFKRKDGRWEARYIHHYENGKAKYKYLYGKSYLEVKAKKNEQILVNEYKKLPQIKGKMKFDTLSYLWLNSIKNSIKESSYSRYIYIVENYLFPKIKNENVLDLDNNFLNNYITYLLNSGGQNNKKLSPKTVCDIVSILKSILKYGEENNYCNVNYTFIKYPQKLKKQVHALSKKDRIRLESLLVDSEDPYLIGILFTLYTGIRIGELCGLQWKNIDLEKNTVIINQTIQRIKNIDENSKTKTKLIVNTPKTKNSIREIPLPSFLVEILKKNVHQKDCYLVTGTPTPMEPHQCYMKYKRFLKKHTFQDYSFHMLRHTFATMCIEYGFDIKTLSEILGHSDITTTLSIYVHPSLELKRKQMEKLKPFHMY